MSSFFNEVMTQPQDMHALVEYYQKNNFNQIIEAKQLLNGADTLVFSGMGTSYYAPFFVKDKLVEKAPLLIESGDLYEYNIKLLERKNTVLVLISQSGESIEICRILSIIPKTCIVIGITNDPDSTLGKKSTCVLPLCASEEKTITNRTYTNTLAVLLLLTCKTSTLDEVASKLLTIADEMSTFLKNKENLVDIKKASELLQPADAIHFIGRGGDGVVSAYQSALIFTEGAKCLGRGCTTGTFHHGPMEMCGPNHRAVLFIQNDSFIQKTEDLCEKMSAIGSKMVVIGGNDIPKKANIHQITLPNIEPEHYAFTAALAFELLLVSTAELRGYIAGHFTNGSKVTKVD